MKRRNTTAQAAILESLKNAKQALSHDQLQTALNLEIDRATIYRVLNRFSADGLVHSVIGDDGKQYFAVCTGCTEKKHQHNHFHFRCQTCSKVECLPIEIQMQLPLGYQAKHFNGFITGVCASCV